MVFCFHRIGPWLGSGLLVCACAANTRAADSPDISGDWSGKISGKHYHDANTTARGTGTSSSAVADHAYGALTASLTQLGNDLTLDATFQASQNNTFSVHLTGRTGDFVLWVTGVHVVDAATTEQVFGVGHVNSKGGKITGTLIFYANNDVTDVGFSLIKKTSGKSRQCNEAPTQLAAQSRAISTVAPYNVVGKLSGKSYLFTSTAKPALLKSALSGFVNPASNSATLTLSANQETFSTLTTIGGTAQVMAGSSGSDQLILFGTATPSAASGVGWIYSDLSLAEFRWNVTKK